MTTGERIRAARKKAGLTQKQLSELTGIAEPTIRRYELGKLNPKYETVGKLAAAMNIPVSTVMPIDANQGYWTDRFLKGLQEQLANIDNTDAVDAAFDMTIAADIAHGIIGFTFEDACYICDMIGTSIDEVLNWDELHKKAPCD